MGLLSSYSHYEANPITNNNLKINAVSGTLAKTFRKSYFVRFEKSSPMEHFYFRENKPSRIVDDCCFGTDYDETYKNTKYKLEEVVVLQTMLCGDNQYLVEAIDKKDYDELFNIVESKGDDK